MLIGSRTNLDFEGILTVLSAYNFGVICLKFIYSFYVFKVFYSLEIYCFGALFKLEFYSSLYLLGFYSFGNNSIFDFEESALSIFIENIASVL